MKITAAGSQSSSKGVVLFTSGVHAREYAPPELLMRFAENLLEKYDTDSDITWILEHNEIHIVFYVNPDGRLKAEQQPNTSWRKNTNPGTKSCPTNYIGVDINRNFDFLWGDSTGASTNPCSSDYMGTSAESEPETKALADYAKSLFPKNQRKSDPESQLNAPFGEEITGLYMDIHAYGGFTYYPWGHRDSKSPDNSSLEALGRKISSFNGYKLWAGGQPDFQYAVSGDTSDYMYAVLGVASFGLEIGNSFYQSCSGFENSILPLNLPALLYAAKVSNKPNSLAKGPDVTELAANLDGSTLTVTATASDSQLVNIAGYPTFETGDQSISGITMSIDVHPNDANGNVVKMTSKGSGFQGSISTNDISSGKHILYVQAKDSDGYLGPVSSMFFTVSSNPTSSPSSGGWIEVVNEDFTNDYGYFKKRGRGVRHYTEIAERSGVIRIRNGGLYAKLHDSYSQLRVKLSALFYSESDELCLEVRPENGAWEEIHCWTGKELDTEMWHDDISIKFDVDSTKPRLVRLICNGSGKRVFIDQASILGMS